MRASGDLKPTISVRAITTTGGGDGQARDDNRYVERRRVGPS